MSGKHTSQSISGYNSSPPPDDGSLTSANEITWAKHKTKLADPVKTLSEAINAELVSAFGKVLGGGISTKSGNYTLVAADEGKFFSVTGTTTITLIDIATAGDGYAVGIVNTGAGVVTVDGSTSETINGSTTVALDPGAAIILTTDGATEWVGVVSLGIGQSGSGSGLDADQVDGQHGSYYRARANHTGTQTLATIIDSGSLAAKNSVAQGDIGSSAVGQGELKTTSGQVSVTATTDSTNLTLPGGSFGLYPQIRINSTNDSARAAWGWHGASNSQQDGGIFTGTTPGVAAATAIGESTSFTAKIVLALTNVTSRTAYARQEYVQASPPHNLGYGEIGRFVFGLVDNASGKVISVYSATEAPWHYNGKTDIRPHKIVGGKKYRARKKMELPYTMKEALSDSAKMLEYAEHFKSAETIYEEITDELKNRDMPDIPHPFVGNDLTGKTVVLLDPACDEMHKMNELCECHDEFSINDLLHDGNIKLDNTPLNVVTPPGVKTVKFRMK